MRKVIVFTHTTIDGFMGRPEDKFDWVTWDTEADEDYTTELMARADTILSGRATYQAFESSWPQRAADPKFGPPAMAEFAQWMVKTPIVVFTHTLTSFEMANARRAERDLVSEVHALKAEPGKDIVVFGGASIVQALVAAGLVDEYWFKVNPIVLGSGLPIFSRVDEKVGLTLEWSKVYDSGVVGLKYAA
ncbi:MAG: deaminase [Corynebacteriales bacterium]|nr:deaminase [Mycobacteriales bacterium]